MPDPEYLQDLERAGIDYELGGLMAFEESSEWRCRCCRHEWREDESSILRVVAESEAEEPHSLAVGLPSSCAYSP